MAGLLLINTGGTIGMVPGENGLVPAPGLIERALAEQAPGLTVQTQAFDPLLDSADVGPLAWNRIIEAVSQTDCAGVIIVHGTDTLAFTGAALHAALTDLRVPVVLCAAMRPLGTKGDASENLALAISAACSQPPGVWLAFAGQVLAAGGLAKVHSSAPDAFRAVHDPAAAGSGGAAPGRRVAQFDPTLRLAILTLSPGLAPAALAAMLAGLDGAVLRVFGAGTMPGDPALAAVLAAAVRRGCRVRAVSQCLAGGLAPGAYAAGAPLWAAGVENGGTQTAEAALMDLWLEQGADDGSG